MEAGFWSTLFEFARPEPGAIEEQLREWLESLSRPPSEAVLDHAIVHFQQNPYPASDPAHDRYVPADPRKWVMPFRGLATSYLAFLRWSNGGTCRNGSREIRFWHCESLRRMMERYFFAEFAPRVVPFASNNAASGDWYGFDTSGEPVAGEFPVVYIHHEVMRERLVLAPSFLDFCRGTEDPEKLYWDWWQCDTGK